MLCAHPVGRHGPTRSFASLNIDLHTHYSWMVCGVWRVALHVLDDLGVHLRGRPAAHEIRTSISTGDLEMLLTACMHMCMPELNYTLTHLHVRVCIWGMPYVHVCTCVDVCLCSCARGHMCVLASVSFVMCRVFVCVCVFACLSVLHVSVYVSPYVCVFVYVLHICDCGNVPKCASTHPCMHAHLRRYVHL
jgi:hypothetical protein